MSGPPLPAGTTISLITTDRPQTLQLARILRPVSDDKDMHDRMPGPYYEIVSADSGRELPQLAVAILTVETSRTTGVVLSLRVSATLPDVQVRSCASNEGLHLTLWSGEPLKARRLWHTYYYLGYDTQPTCQSEDVRDQG